MEILGFAVLSGAKMGDICCWLVVTEFHAVGFFSFLGKESVMGLEDLFYPQQGKAHPWADRRLVRLTFFSFLLPICMHSYSPGS